MRRLVLAVALLFLAACSDATRPDPDAPVVFTLTKVERIEGNEPIPNYAGTLELYERRGRWVQHRTITRDGVDYESPDSGTYTKSGAHLRYVSERYGREHAGILEGNTLRNAEGVFLTVWERKR